MGNRNNEVHIVPRTDNINLLELSLGRTHNHVNKELMQWYSAYLIEEYPEDIDCDFVFVVIKAQSRSWHTVNV